MAEFVHQANILPRLPLEVRDVTYEAGPPFVDAVSKAVARGVTDGLVDEGAVSR